MWSSGRQHCGILCDALRWELDIGTCWVNYFANFKLESALNLPDNERAVLLMPIGYPAEDAAPHEKMHSVCKKIEENVRYI